MKADRGAEGGWSAVKWNRCTGEALVFSVGHHPKYSDEAVGAWHKNPVK